MTGPYTAPEPGDARSLIQFLRHMAARWIATPWWNLRFTLGFWLGGFTHAERPYPQRKESA